jgi:hypothetical protein
MLTQSAGGGTKGWWLHDWAYVEPAEPEASGYDLSPAN